MSQTTVQLLLPEEFEKEFYFCGKEYIAEEGTLLVLREGTPAPKLAAQRYATAMERPPAEGCYCFEASASYWIEQLRALEPEDPRARPLAEFILMDCGVHRLQAPIAASRDGALFEAATAYLRERAAEQLRVEDLAEHLGISLSHLKRIFARFAGKGAKEYFNDLKIDYAKELLEQGQSVTQTAALAGFANQAYFSAAFKRITGQSPKAFAGKKSTVSTPAPKKKKQTPQAKKDLPSYLL